MDKINKYKQNNHNAHGANRRRRRPRIHFKTRPGQWARTVTRLAKTPAVQILSISNVPSDVLEAIDDIAARQDRSRSSFVRRELQRIVAEYHAQEALSKSPRATGRSTRSQHRQSV
jgi:Ribbon-helix-helix protein, copG family.